MDGGQIKKISLEERKKTFKEVSLGFSQEEALKEAMRCLQCKRAPCIKGCPAGIDIKEFISFIRKKDYIAALNKIKESNSLPGVCGRVCPQEEQCQVACILEKKGNPIKIGYLERFVADWGLEQNYSNPDNLKINDNGIKVAVIGCGPAGITCAYDLRKLGFSVYLFESLHKPGGVLMYGIPEFRLPKIIVEKEVELIKKIGVKIIYNFVVGRTKTIEDLRQEGFKAFFIAVGAGLPKLLDIPGENAIGIYSANEFLTRTNLMKSYLFPQFDTPLVVGKKVGVIGGGNVAFDSSRCALRLGAENVTIIYRRTKNEMPARKEEIENALEEGIICQELTSPVKILVNKDGKIEGLICIKNILGDPDSSGRASPKEIPGSEFTINLDTLIIAVGTSANPLLISTIKDLELNKYGYIKVNENFQATVSDIFSGGDIVSGSATVISAIEQAKKAAINIKNYISCSGGASRGNTRDRCPCQFKGGKIMEEKPKLTESQEKNWTMFCHLGGLTGYLSIIHIPLLNIILPLILWLMKKDQSPLVNEQGKEAINFQISVTLYATACIPLCFILIGIPLLVGIAIFNLIMIILAAIDTQNDKKVHYPLCIRFLK